MLKTGPAKRVILKYGRNRRALVVQGEVPEVGAGVNLDDFLWTVTKVEDTEVIAVIPQKRKCS